MSPAVARPRRPQGGGRRVRTQVGLGVREHALDGTEHEVVDPAAVAEAHFELGGVRVDVDEPRIERQIQHVGGMAPVVEHVAVGEAHRVHEQPIAHRAAVDEPELLVRLRARARRQADPSREHERPGRLAQRQRGGGKLARHDRLDARELARSLGDRRGIEQHARPVPQSEAHVEARQGEPLDQARDVAELGGIALHEAPPGRHVVEELTHLDGGAGRMRRRARPGEHPALAADLGRALRRLGARGDAQARHGADRGQCLAAKAERRHRLEILERVDLAGRVARERERQFRAGDATAVVAHPHQGDAAALDVDLDAARTRIEAVFHELLDHGGGPLDYLARGDLIDEFAGENTDSHLGRQVYRPPAAAAPG